MDDRTSGVAPDTPRHGRPTTDHRYPREAAETAVDAQAEADGAAPTARQDRRRGRLAALGRVIAELTRLTAVVQFPEDSRTWVLRVTNSYIGPDAPAEVVHCDLINGAWDFYWSTGAPIGSADDLMTAAKRIAGAMGVSVRR